MQAEQPPDDREDELLKEEFNSTLDSSSGESANITVVKVEKEKKKKRRKNNKKDREMNKMTEMDTSESSLVKVYHVAVVRKGYPARDLVVALSWRTDAQDRSKWKILLNY